MKQQQVIDQIKDQAQKIEKDKRELKINNDHKLDPWKMKDLEQKLIDLNKLNKKNHLIYDFQDQICSKIQTTGLREKTEYSEILERIVNTVLFSKEKHEDHQAVTLEDFKDIIHEENIIYLTSLAEVNLNMQDKYWENLLKDLDGIDYKSMNCLHWILYAKRDDIFSWVMENFYKSQVKKDPESVSSRGIEAHILQNCFIGQSNKFSVVHSNLNG